MGQVFTWGKPHPGRRVSMTTQNKNTLNKHATIVGIPNVSLCIGVFSERKKGSSEEI
jgi:hypothetical protein